MSESAGTSTTSTWSGRFTEPVSELVKRYTASVFFDLRMAQQDIRGSLAHARMLAKQNIIAAADLAAIERGMEHTRGDRDQHSGGDFDAAQLGNWQDDEGLSENPQKFEPLHFTSGCSARNP